MKRAHQTDTLKKTVNLLMVAVIQEQDVEGAMNAIDKLGLAIARLPSTGGFLGRRNATLLIALHQNQEKETLRAIRKSCHRRIEYVATPLEGSPLPFPSPTPVTVGGATLFTFDVDRYEEF